MIDIQEHLDRTESFAINAIVKSMWIDVLRIALDKSNGCVLEASEHLGVCRATILSKCHIYGINIDDYRTVKLKVRPSKAEKHKLWFEQISSVLDDKTVSVREAARRLEWPRATLCRRIEIVGYKR